MTHLKLFLITIFACSFGNNQLFAQKAKFKNQKAVCQKIRLPQNYIEPENRTYNIYKKGAYAENVEAGNRGIYGWTIDLEQPKLEGVVSIYGFQVNPVNRDAKNREKKDKDGNVTDRWTDYTYSSSATGKGTLYIYGESNPFEYKKVNSKKSKLEEKREALAAAKKESLSKNPFLTSEDVVDAEDKGESDIGEDAGLDNALLPLIKTISLDVSESVTSKTYRSASAAYKDYKSNQRPKLGKFKYRYPDLVFGKAINTLNYQYGYSPVNYSIWLKQMKTDKHPEFQTWNDACEATVTLFKAFKHNKSIDGNQAKFDPIIAYFNQQIEKIADNDRKAKKVKKAAFHNMVNIMYYLDRYEEVIALCKKYKDSKLLDKIAERMLNQSDRQVALLAFHKMESCHLESMEDIGEDAIETEETSFEEEGDEGK